MGLAIRQQDQMAVKTTWKVVPQAVEVALHPKGTCFLVAVVRPS